MKYFLLSLLLFVGCADDSTKVVRVIDGDTITILQNNEEYKVRLAEIDCPERQQPFHTQAKNLTSDLAFGKKVIIVSGGFDRYHRILAEVQLPDGKSLNQELVRSGMAWQNVDCGPTRNQFRLGNFVRKSLRRFADTMYRGMVLRFPFSNRTLKDLFGIK